MASIIQLSKLWVDITAECARARECASVRKCFAMFYVVRVCLFVCAVVFVIGVWARSPAVGVVGVGVGVVV